MYYFSLFNTVDIDTINRFVKVSFEAATSSISLKFINQPKLNKKFYEVKYGPVTPGCKKLEHHMEGYLFNSNFISLEISIDMKQSDEICFLVMVNNGTKTVNVKGIYRAGENGFYFILIIYVGLFDLTASSDSKDIVTIPPHAHVPLTILRVAVAAIGLILLCFGVILYYLSLNKRTKSGERYKL